MVLARYGGIFAKKLFGYKNCTKNMSSIGGNPQDAVPFKLGSHNRMTALFFLYFIPPFWAPYFIVTYQLLKENK